MPKNKQQMENTGQINTKRKMYPNQQRFQNNKVSTQIKNIKHHNFFVDIQGHERTRLLTTKDPGYNIEQTNNTKIGYNIIQEKTNQIRKENQKWGPLKWVKFTIPTKLTFENEINHKKQQKNTIQKESYKHTTQNSNYDSNSESDQSINAIITRKEITSRQRLQEEMRIVKNSILHTIYTQNPKTTQSKQLDGTTIYIIKQQQKQILHTIIINHIPRKVHK